jgi:hypothetical protein
MDIVERLREGKFAGGKNVMHEAAEEIERLREENMQLKTTNQQQQKVLRMWADFWEADGEVDIFLGEEAMESTRELFGVYK